MARLRIPLALAATLEDAMEVVDENVEEEDDDDADVGTVLPKVVDAPPTFETAVFSLPASDAGVGKTLALVAEDAGV